MASISTSFKVGIYIRNSSRNYKVIGSLKVKNCYIPVSLTNSTSIGY